MAADKPAEKAEKPDKKSDKKDAAAAPAAPAAGGSGKMVMILTIVNVVITLGVAGVLFMQFKKDKAHQSPADIQAEESHDEHAAAGEHGGGEHGVAGGHGGGEHGAAAEGHGGGEHGDKKDAPGAPKFGKVIVLDQFTINLSAAGSVNPKFARVNISLEIPADEVESELQQKMPQVRNAVIDLFNSKKPSDLSTPEGRNYLKEEIRNALNNFLVTGKVKGVFFTNFAVTG